MVEAVAMMITAAHVTDMVEVETVTQAAEVISTQVVVIGLADKKEGFPLLWKGGTLLHEIPTAVQAAEHQEVVAVEEADLIEGEAEADIKNKQLEFWSILFLLYVLFLPTFIFSSSVPFTWIFLFLLPLCYNMDLQHVNNQEVVS